MNIGQQHIQARRQLFKNLQPFPSAQGLRRFFDYLMYTVGVLAPLALLPQVTQLYAHKDAAGLSLVTWTLLGSINVLWVIYAALHRAYPILLANIGMALLNFTIVLGIFLYR